MLRTPLADSSSQTARAVRSCTSTTATAPPASPSACAKARPMPWPPPEHVKNLVLQAGHVLTLRIDQSVCLLRPEDGSRSGPRRSITKRWPNELVSGTSSAKCKTHSTSPMPEGRVLPVTRATRWFSFMRCRILLPARPVSMSSPRCTCLWMAASPVKLQFCATCRLREASPADG